jgi:pilus assembly protein Flp/PilA
MLDRLMVKLVAVLNDRKGISALEYGILAAGIIGVVATAAATVGTDLGALLNAIGVRLTNAANAL